ncbi:MAG: prolyl oligopeptidase family serine peptidase [Gemmatimonadales bacterium]
MSKLVRIVALAALLVPAVVDAQIPVTVERDVVYGRHQGSGLLADIAYPVGGEELPVIMYVHGGRWRGGERQNDQGLQVAEWAGRGFFAMTVSYRLVLASPAPLAYQDLQTAIRWVHAHADQYGIDENRIYLIGNSAGGHMVALAATLGEGPYERISGWENARSDVTAVISAAGAYDLNTLSWGNLWTPLEGDPIEARRLASPLHHIGPATKPILVVHSDDDQSVPIQQAVDFAAALERAGVQHRFVHLTDAGHMSVTPRVIEETLRFIEEVEGDRQ